MKTLLLIGAVVVLAIQFWPEAKSYTRVPVGSGEWVINHLADNFIADNLTRCHQ